MRDRMPGLADKVLTQRLKELETRGLVAKTRGDKPRTGHAWKLTKRGESLRPVLDALYKWGAAMASEMEVRIAPGIAKSSG